MTTSDDTSSDEGFEEENVPKSSIMKLSAPNENKGEHKKNGGRELQPVFDSRAAKKSHSEMLSQASTSDVQLPSSSLNPSSMSSTLPQVVSERSQNELMGPPFSSSTVLKEHEVALREKANQEEISQLKEALHLAMHSKGAEALEARFLEQVKKNKNLTVQLGVERQRATQLEQLSDATKKSASQSQKKGKGEEKTPAQSSQKLPAANRSRTSVDKRNSTGGSPLKGKEKSSRFFLTMSDVAASAATSNAKHQMNYLPPAKGGSAPGNTRPSRTNSTSSSTAEDPLETDGATVRQWKATVATLRKQLSEKNDQLVEMKQEVALWKKVVEKETGASKETLAKLLTQYNGPVVRKVVKSVLSSTEVISHHSPSSSRSSSSSSSSPSSDSSGPTSPSGKADRTSDAICASERHPSEKEKSSKDGKMTSSSGKKEAKGKREDEKAKHKSAPLSPTGTTADATLPSKKGSRRNTAEVEGEAAPKAERVGTASPSSTKGNTDKQDGSKEPPLEFLGWKGRAEIIQRLRIKLKEKEKELLAAHTREKQIKIVIRCLRGTSVAEEGLDMAAVELEEEVFIEDLLRELGIELVPSSSPSSAAPQGGARGVRKPSGGGGGAGEEEGTTGESGAGGKRKKELDAVQNRQQLSQQAATQRMDKKRQEEMQQQLEEEQLRKAAQQNRLNHLLREVQRLKDQQDVMRRKSETDDELIACYKEDVQKVTKKLKEAKKQQQILTQRLQVAGSLRSSGLIGRSLEAKNGEEMRTMLTSSSAVNPVLESDPGVESEDFTSVAKEEERQRSFADSRLDSSLLISENAMDEEEMKDDDEKEKKKKKDSSSNAHTQSLPEVSKQKQPKKTKQASESSGGSSGSASAMKTSKTKGSRSGSLDKKKM